MPKRKYKKMTKLEQKLASKYIAEERKVKKGGKKKYKTKQAVAIGISRARAATKRKNRK